MQLGPFRTPARARLSPPVSRRQRKHRLSLSQQRAVLEDHPTVPPRAALCFKTSTSLPASPLVAVQSAARLVHEADVAGGDGGGGADLGFAHLREEGLDVPDAGVDLDGLPARVVEVLVEEPVDEALRRRRVSRTRAAARTRRAPACARRTCGGRGPSPRRSSPSPGRPAKDASVARRAGEDRAPGAARWPSRAPRGARPGVRRSEARRRRRRSRRCGRPAS